METCECQTLRRFTPLQILVNHLDRSHADYSMAGEGVFHAVVNWCGALASLLDQGLTAKSALICPRILRNVQAKLIREVVYV